MEDEKRRKGSVVAGEEINLKEKNNKIEVPNTIEEDIVKDDENVQMSKEAKSFEKVENENQNKLKDEISNKEDRKTKKNNKKISKRLLAIILVAISCISITICFIIIQFMRIDEKYKLDEPTNVFESEDKKIDEDKKYVVGENDTLDINDLNAEVYYIVDGVEYTNRSEKFYEIINLGNEVYSTVKISGLKNKELENTINNSIFQKIEDFAKENDIDIGKVNCYVAGNFNDILSIMIYSSQQANIIGMGYNIDLNTGNEIPFEDVFTKSAPIASLLANGFSEKLAWDFEIDVDHNVVGDEEYFKRRDYFLNMNNRDTSDYEEKGLEVANWYKENKGNIRYTVNPFSVTVYDVKTKDKTYNVVIPLYENKDCVAIYKRFKSSNSIYENDISGSGYIPFSMPMSFFSNCKNENQVEYGRVLNNLFVDIGVYAYTPFPNENIANMSKTFIQNIIQEEKNKAIENPTKFFALQGSILVSNNIDYTEHYNSEIGGYCIPHYRVSISYEDIELNDYDELMEGLAITALLPRASTDVYTLNYYNRVYKNNGQKLPENKSYFFDVDGNYLGDDIMVVKDTSKDSYNPS